MREKGPNEIERDDQAMLSLQEELQRMAEDVPEM